MNNGTLELQSYGKNPDNGLLGVMTYAGLNGLPKSPFAPSI